MSYSLQNLTHANDLKYMSAYFAVAASMWTALYTVKRFRSSPLISCLLWVGKDFAKTLKTILFTKLTCSICFQKMNLDISAGFVYQGFFFGFWFFPSWESYLEFMKLFFLQSNLSYNDCLGKTTEMWMSCLVSTSHVLSWLLFYFFSRITGV